MKQREMMNKQELTLEALETVCGGTIGPVLPDWSWLIEDEKKGRRRRHRRLVIADKPTYSFAALTARPNANVSGRAGLDLRTGIFGILRPIFRPLFHVFSFFVVYYPFPVL